MKKKLYGTDEARDCTEMYTKARSFIIQISVAAAGFKFHTYEKGKRWEKSNKQQWKLEMWFFFFDMIKIKWWINLETVVLPYWYRCYLQLFEKLCTNIAFENKLILFTLFIF